eukprot:2866444-Rhodomonas_salina.2
MPCAERRGARGRRKRALATQGGAETDTRRPERDRREEGRDAREEEGGRVSVSGGKRGGETW